MSTLHKATSLACGIALLACTDGSRVTAPEGDAAGTVALAPGDPRGGRPVECVGAFTGATPGNLVVPEGSFCIILGATIGGNVLVESGAIGFHSHNSTIEGSVHSPGPIVFDVRILNTIVAHNVDIRQTRSGTAGAICRSQIGGNVTLKQNAGFMNVGIGFPSDVCTAGNTIAGNVHIDENTGVIQINNNTVEQSLHVNDNTGAITVIRNTVAHTLECNGNVPAPVSALNTANNFVGQCQA